MEKNTNNSFTELQQNKLPVAQFNYVGSSQKTWEEIFDGFDTLEAITYSSGLTFINKVLEKFEKATIILGSDKTISMELSQILAFQTATLQDLNKLYNKKHSRVHSMLKEESLHFWVAKSKMSHEKLFLLSNSNTGDTRVIFGSANFSFQAFSNLQRELICYCDNDEKAFNYFKTEFNILQDICCDIIPYEKIKEFHNEENINELPFAQDLFTIENEKAVKELLIVEPVQRNEDEIRFVLDVNNLSKQFKQFTPPQPKTKVLRVLPETIVKITRKIQERFKDNEENGHQNPEFVFDYENLSANYNNKQFDLHPIKDDIKNDVTLFVDYMNGFSQFFGKTELMQKEYYKFVVWFFCSPFMAKFRLIASQADKAIDPYPVFGLLYGSSKAGKTTFVKTLYKMTFGVKKISHAGDFTTRQVEGLKRSVKGIPLFYDDVVQKTFNDHGPRLIKHEDFGFDEFLDNYPCVVITGNEDIKAVDQFISRRVVLCHVTAGITNMQLMQNSVAKTIQKKIGTALYREYLRRLMEHLPSLVEQLQDEDNKDVVDLIAISSKVLNEIIKEYIPNIPDFMTEVSLENYFDEHQTSAIAIESIQESWKTNPEIFSIYRKKNILQIRYGTHWEAINMKKQLPANLCPDVTGVYLRVNLDEAGKFFGILFKKRWWIK